MMTQDERLIFLLRDLLAERKEYEDIPVPDSLSEKRRLLRSLMNVRPPVPVREDFLRVQDAYRLAHYDENLRTAAQAVEQGVVERIQQRAARPTENGIRPGGAATVRPDVASMTRAQREALERRVLHGAQIEL